MPHAAPPLPRAGLAMFLLVIGVLAGCAATPAPCATNVPPDAALAGYRLGPGDLVRVTVFRQPDLSGQFRLDGDGHLPLPLAGEVRAGNLTTRELEQAIAAQLRDGNFLVDPQVGAQVLTYRPFYILGEVGRAGQYEYRDGMTLINAVAMAGGYRHRAKASAVTIERGACIMPAQPDTPVLPNDVIRVPERFF
jgi:protein involved in polysaccharide export with SLBB domain